MEILFWGHGPKVRNETIRMHKHSFAQIEIILQGRRRCKSLEDDILLQEGEMVMVPFNVEHIFSNPSDDLEYLSFKFRPDKEFVMPSRIFKIFPDPFVDWIIKDFREITRNKIYNTSPVYHELINALFNALHTHLRQGKMLNPESPMMDYIRKYILRVGAQATVDELAVGLGMSVYKFRRKFKRTIREQSDCGANYTSPQMFIKNELLNIACKYLRESDVKIGELSDMLNFNNIYVFSRFLKNNTGLSPREYRRKYSQLK